MPTGVYKRTEKHRNILKLNRKGMLGKKHSEETKKKLSLARLKRKKRLGYINSPEARKKLSLAIKGKNHPFYGKHRSKKVKQKISESLKGREFSEERKRNLSKNNLRYWLGQKRSKETKKKISLTLKGKKLSKEHCKNISIARLARRSRLGYINSLETKNKIRNSIKKDWENYSKKDKEIRLKNLKEARKYQVMPTEDTKIEVKIQNFLKQLGIEFFTHQYISQIKHSYRCDILIPSMNMVIECDGDYWHKYPIGNDIDHIRTKELLEKGFKVLRLWEFEINAMELNDFKNKLEE